MNFEITDTASEKLNEVMQTSDLKNPALRILFSGFGWGGPRLGLALDELPENSDKTVVKKINIVFDETVKKLVDAGSKVTVDFKETPYGSGFVVDSGANC